MRDRTSPDLSHPAEASQEPRLKRGLFGYRRSAVDETLMRLRLDVHALEDEAVTLREELLDARHEASETRHDLTRAKAELRYWNDRASYVDSEVARARHRATDLEQAARERADAIEADAQERSLQLVDRVCTEANAMLQAAREEARDMFLRFETDVDMSQQKLEKLEQVRTEVARAMQGALEQFEDAVRELDKVGPVRRIVASLEQPVRRTVPNFGQQKALDAAKRFEESATQGATAAMSTPLASQDADDDEMDVEVGDETTIEGRLSIDDPITIVDPAAGDEVVFDTAESEADPRDDEQPRRAHDADEEFASLLLNP